MLEGWRCSELGAVEAIENFALRRIGYLLKCEFFDILSVGTNDSELDSLHFVPGQSACLIRADHTCATKSLYGGKAAHDAVVSGHLTGTKGEACSDDSWKAFGDSSHGKSDSNLEIVDAALDRMAVNGIPEFVEVHKPDKEADDEDDLGEKLTKVVDLLFQRCLLLILISCQDLGVYAADRCLHACISNNSGSCSRRYDC